LLTLFAFLVRLFGVSFGFFLLLSGGFRRSFVGLLRFLLALFNSCFAVPLFLFLLLPLCGGGLRGCFALGPLAFDLRAWAFSFGPAVAGEVRTKAVAVEMPASVTHFDQRAAFGE